MAMLNNQRVVVEHVFDNGWQWLTNSVWNLNITMLKMAKSNYVWAFLYHSYVELPRD